MREIPLTQGKVALVDDADYEYLNQYKWHAQLKGNSWYASRRARKDQDPMHHPIGMHQDIIGKKEGFVTDHINGDGLFNCRENLRFVTRRQNNQNRHHKKLSKYPGVTWCKNKSIWKTSIRVKGKSIYLGTFKDELDAFNAYKKAVIEIGESVVLMEVQ